YTAIRGLLERLQQNAGITLAEAPCTSAPDLGDRRRATRGAGVARRPGRVRPSTPCRSPRVRCCPLFRRNLPEVTAVTGCGARFGQTSGKANTTGANRAGARRAARARGALGWARLARTGRGDR